MIAPARTHSLDERVRLDRIRIFFGHASGNMASIMVGALLIGIVLSLGGVALSTLIVWGLLLGAMCVVVWLFEQHVQRVGIRAENCLRLVNIRIALGAGVALFYGVASFFLPESASQVQDTFLFIILSTVITVGALGYAVMPAYYLTLNIVSLLPLTGRFAYQYWSHGDAYYLLLVVVSLVWQLVVLKKAGWVSQTAIKAIVLNVQLQDEIEEHKRTKEAIRHMALHDALTGVGNRRYFEETLSHTLGTAARHGRDFGLLSIDLNHFKPVNDLHGHAVGDRLLTAIAVRLAGQIRNTDFLARVGGDEFAIIVDNALALSDTADIVEGLRSVFVQPFVFDAIVVHAGASIGWAMYPRDGTDTTELLAVADRRMYLDKQSVKDLLD